MKQVIVDHKIYRFIVSEVYIIIRIVAEFLVMKRFQLVENNNLLIF